MIKAERAQTKSGNGAIGYRRILPWVEIMLLGDTPRNGHTYMFEGFELKKMCKQI